MTQTLTLRDLTLNFFTTFGASSKRLDRRKLGGSAVELPQGLADHFGKPALHLVFQNADLTSDAELVVYGSRVFDQMLAYLDRQGSLTVQELPARHHGADELLRAVQPINVAIAGLQLSEQKRQIFVFNWHVTYRADDKREELFSVVVDEHGQRVRLTAQATGDTEDIDIGALLADAQPLPVETDDEGQPLPPKLPPMTQLTRLAESARKHALYHADVRCVSHEAEILPRLHKVLARLTGYYEQQIEEVYDAHDANGEKRRLLEEDLQRKIAEEVENHRLRVDVRLFSYAMLYVPVANAQIRISDGKREATIDVTRNRYTGALRRPTCHVCRQPITALMLCRNEHLICATCSVQCTRCKDALCQSCGVHACPTCGQANCETCSVLCWSCGERACADHVSRCPVCGDDTCHTCQEACADCGERQCRSHLRVDSVDGALLCAACAVRCPGCHSYTHNTETCSVSGQRFCQLCIVHCQGCQRPLGPGLAVIDPLNGQPYCADCLQPCPHCAMPTALILSPGCTSCGTRLCGHCAIACQTCGDLLCVDDITSCADCNNPLCTRDTLRCAVGGETLCIDCATVCAICSTQHCREHSTACPTCLQSYCAACMGGREICATCVELVTHGQEVAIVDEPIFADPRIVNIWNRHDRRMISNRRYTLYLGVDTGARLVLVVAEAEKVLHIRRGKALAKLSESV